MTFTVYVIKDERDRWYTGYTSDIDRRLWEHNNGFIITTKKGKNWKIMYLKIFDNKHDAIMYERLLKTGKGRDLIKN